MTCSWWLIHPARIAASRRRRWLSEKPAGRARLRLTVLIAEEVAEGAKVVFQGVMAQFSLAGLAAVRGGSGEFFITAIGAGREEKNFKVKPKHFSSLR
jgi:hypothetical protein